jgi:hypothetical protein
MQVCKKHRKTESPSKKPKELLLWAPPARVSPPVARRAALRWADAARGCRLAPRLNASVRHSERHTPRGACVMRELISLHIGGAGARIGDAAWALALEEHGARCCCSCGGGAACVQFRTAHARVRFHTCCADGNCNAVEPRAQG